MPCPVQVARHYAHNQTRDIQANCIGKVPWTALPTHRLHEGPLDSVLGVVWDLLWAYRLSQKVQGELHLCKRRVSKLFHVLCKWWVHEPVARRRVLERL